MFLMLMKTTLAPVKGEWALTIMRDYMQEKMHGMIWISFATTIVDMLVVGYILIGIFFH